MRTQNQSNRFSRMVRCTLSITIILGTIACNTEPIQVQPSQTAIRAIETATPATVNPVHLPDPEVENGDLQITNPDGSLTVKIQDGFDRNHPPMLSYIWHINPDVDQNIQYILVEFELLDTVPPGDGDLFGYERGYFVGLYDFHELSMEAVFTEVNQEISDPLAESTLDNETLLCFPEFSVDLERYVSKEGTSILVTIPYEQFRGGARELVVQFLPGATFTQPTASLKTNQSLDVSIIEELTSDSEEKSIFDHTTFFQEYWNDPLPIDFLESDEIPEGETRKSLLRDKIRNENWITDFVDVGTLFNDDYSINMPVSDFSSLYGTEDLGDYAIIPEGLPVLLFSFHENRIGNKTADFILEHMVDERGLIKGVWDSQNNVLVDTAWEPASLPVVDALSAYTNAEQYQRLWNAVIDYEVISINDSWYYAPRGINEEGVVEFSTWDFIGAGGVLNLMDVNSSIPEEKGVKMLTAFANSLELFLEAQELNPTKLPAERFSVHFHEDGSHSIESADSFWIDNPYFYIMSLFYGAQLNSKCPYIGRSMLEGETFENYLDWIAASDDPQYRAETYPKAVDLAFEFETFFRILKVNYKSLYYVYSFARMQGQETAFAPGYDVCSGEPLYLDSLDTNAEGSGSSWDMFQQRYGTPRHLINWTFLSGFANDKAMAYTGVQGVSISMAVFRQNLLPENYRELYKGLDYFALLERNGIQITNDGGYISRGYAAHYWPGESRHQYSFAWAESFSWRENLGEFMQRKLIENGLREIDIIAVE